MSSFSLIRVCICILLQIFPSVHKEVDKNIEKKPKILATRITEMAGAIFLQISYVDSPTAQAVVIANITVDGVNIIGVPFCLLGKESSYM